MKRIFMALWIACCAVGLMAQSGEEEAARQARSVHLQYRGWKGPASVFYLEGTPQQVYPGTYFCLLGFDGGYCGIQQIVDGRHVAIFSVWEPGDPFDFSAHPDAVEEGKRTKALYVGENVEVARFWGEGTGGKSMMLLNWEVGKPVCMAISVAKDGPYRTAYTCWIWDDQKQDWFRMATFSTLVNDGKAELTYPYAFLEDFLRNGESRNHVRRARTSRLWAWNGSEWTASQFAGFTADNNTLTNIDAGPAADGFWFATGGATANVTAPLWSKIIPGGAPDDSAARRVRLIEVIKAAAAAPAPVDKPLPEPPADDPQPEAPTPEANPAPEAPAPEAAPEAAPPAP